jgi:hypothetical protein
MWQNNNYGFGHGSPPGNPQGNPQGNLQGNPHSPNEFNLGGPEQQYPPFSPPFYPQQYDPDRDPRLELHLLAPYGVCNDQRFLRNQMGPPRVPQVS